MILQSLIHNEKSSMFTFVALSKLSPSNHYLISVISDKSFILKDYFALQMNQFSKYNTFLELVQSYRANALVSEDIHLFLHI